MSEIRQFSGEIAPEVMQQAAEWFVRLRSEDPSTNECSAWCHWIEAEPAHRMAFARIQHSWDISGAMPHPAWPTPEELMLDAGRVQSPRLFFRARSRLTGLALAAGIAAIGVWLLQPWLSAERISTGRGGQQTSVLSDGSRIELGGLTSVDVKFTREQRLIVAEEGEAFYKVARDPARPFVVRSGPVSITALGTAFAVRREGESVSITVQDGRIEVSSVEHGPRGALTTVRASAGESVRFENGALTTSVSEPTAVTAWRPGQLRFEDEPLRVVVASLNRYSRRPIEITDPALGELQFTGTVFDAAIDRWLETIEVVFPVRVRRTDERILIEPVVLP